MEPLVSVIMAAYNSEKYISESIESILNQTYKNIEFIIVNDGSSDKSLEIIKNYAYKDNRIKVIDNKKNMGLVYCLNKGIKESTGKYIARMDSDDISVYDRIQRQVKYMEENSNLTMSGGSAFVFRGKNKRIHKLLNVPTGIDKVKSKLFFENCFIHPTVIIKRDDLVRHNLSYDNIKGAEDIDLWLRMLNLNLKFDNINQPLLYYRLSSTSITSKENKNIENRYEVFKQYRGRLFDILDIEKSEENFRILFEIVLDTYIKDKKFSIHEKNNFLKMILLKNNKLKYFNTSIFSRICSEKFYFLCINRLNYKIYKESEISRFYKSSKVKFYLRAILYFPINKVKNCLRN